MHIRLYFHAIVLAASLFGAAGNVYAGETPEKLPHIKKENYSASLYGPLGLNTVPSARMDKAGVIRVGVSILDPYRHGFIGFQIADPLYVQLRQSGTGSRLGDTPDGLYPGMDLKIRLAKEDRYTPEIALGMNSAFGHKKTASEYIALSKRWRDFDFTGGIAWGRLGSEGTLSNPFKKFSRHFSHDRNFNSETPNGANDWFTGEEIGLFAGVEYFTPLDGLSVKAEWGADSYEADQAAVNFKAPAPWSLSLNYAPYEWMDVSAGMVGTDKIFARLSFQGNLFKWPGRNAETGSPVPLHPHRTGTASAQKMMLSAQKNGILLFDTQHTDFMADGLLDLSPFEPAARQIGRAARHMANNGGHKVESLSITPYTFGLKGHRMTLIRRDLESALAHNNGSPEEIWQDTTIEETSNEKKKKSEHIFLWHPRLILDTRLSLSEEDSGILYRSSLVFEETKQLPYGFTVGAAARLNIDDNLHRLADFHPAALHPVRSDEDLYASRLLALDRSYLSWFKTLKTDLHIALSAGALEEMYTGAGGEILYRPFGKTFAVGAEAWRVYKRDPADFLGSSFFEDPSFTGHLNLWYEVPNTDLTLFAKAGRYLGEDFGASGGLETRFENGAKIKAFLSATNENDRDIFGGKTNLYGGLQLSLPLGNIKYLPKGSELRFTSAPFGRNKAQTLDKPLPLYEVTEPMSYRRLIQSWQEVLN